MADDYSDWMRREQIEVCQRRQRAFMPIAEKPAGDKPATGKTATGKTTTGKTTASNSAVEQSADFKPENVVGLAISGGGIRSALYNDGFLQGLSHRGFLRYVDYICSVSGGGYITGHLISQTKLSKDRAKVNFHDDDERWKLGREPDTGQVDPNRLAGIGGYLSRPFEFIPAYLWSFFFSLAFYIGMVGVVATLAALFWRSFDEPVFRRLFTDTLGLTTGGELLIAFIPAILMLLITIFGEAGCSCFRFFVGFEKYGPRGFHLNFRKVCLLLCALAILTSFAIFLGNGTTSVRSNASGKLFLNNYAQILALIAGTIQVLVFLGQDRLFKSERSEAKQWQKYVQQSVTTFVLMFLTFSMVHWMGRENISEFTYNRDPHLVRGDVTNWYALHQLFSKYDQKTDKLSENINPIDKVDVNLKPNSKWVASLAISRLGSPFDILQEEDLFLDKPASIPQKAQTAENVAGVDKVITLPKRLYGAVIAYYLAVLSNHEMALPPAPSKSDQAGQPDLPVEEPSMYSLMTEHMRRVLHARNEQNTLLNGTDGWNTKLEQSDLTPFLLTGMKKKLDISKLADLEKWLNIAEMPDSHRDQLKTQMRRFSVSALDGTKLTPSEAKPSETLLIATVNRLLLESMFPSVVSQHDIPSTMVVPPFDQQTRRRWLGFWMILMLVGMVGGLGPSRVATVFQFYRQQLSANFLIATHDHARKYGDIELHDLHPTSNGLPYPLFLAASLEPSTCNGSYQVVAEPFVFSPLYCGNFDLGKPLVPSKQLSFSCKPGKPSMTLGDAVTLSGAAVTPLMTGNRWLSVILDFFNTGIGQRVQRLDRTETETAQSTHYRALMAGLIGLAVLIMCVFVIELGWIRSVLASVTILLLMFCIANRVGSPGLIRSFIFPHEGQGHQSTKSKMAAQQPRSFYVADGGYCDYLGVSELLRRRCELIVVSDAGANIGGDSLGTLARMCTKASQEAGILFLDLDHEAPIDFGRLVINDQRLVHQPYLCMRIRYPEPDAAEGLLFYCQMSITDTDPIEIKQTRALFPSFPDEPTVNQFYSPKQVAAYRSLGYHIANRLCNELQRWPVTARKTIARPTDAALHEVLSEPNPRLGERSKRFLQSLLGSDYNDENTVLSQAQQANGQPNFNVVKERLLTAYRLVCYEELSYQKEDIFSEAIWPTNTFAFPTFLKTLLDSIGRFSVSESLSGLWLREYERSADVRSAYRTAVISDINSVDIGTDCLNGVLWSVIESSLNLDADAEGVAKREAWLAGHLSCIAAACQEVHRGRPHSAFQIGGRDKLTFLTRSITKVISQSLREQGEFKGTGAVDVSLAMDQVIAELIELKRSVFQGSEHVTTISFAQCMSTLWGNILRRQIPSEDIPVDFVNDMISRFFPPVKTPQEQLYECLLKLNLVKESTAAARVALEQTQADQPADVHFVESRVVELRSHFHQGLSEMRLNKVRDALTKSWYLGYFAGHEIHGQIELRRKPVKQPTAKQPRTRVAKSANTAQAK